jgi:hypothetical protein
VGGFSSETARGERISIKKIFLDRCVNKFKDFGVRNVDEVFGLTIERRNAYDPTAIGKKGI